MAKTGKIREMLWELSQVASCQEGVLKPQIEPSFVILAALLASGWLVEDHNHVLLHHDDHRMARCSDEASGHVNVAF